METKRRFYITETAKGRVNDLGELIQDFEENFPKSHDPGKEDFSNINYSVMEMVNTFGRPAPMGTPPVEVTEDQLIQEGWTKENIQELIDEDFLEEIEFDALDELRDLIRDKGIMDLFTPKDGNPQPLKDVEDLLEKIFDENKQEDLEPFEYNTLFWIKNNLAYFKQMLQLEAKYLQKQG